MANKNGVRKRNWVDPKTREKIKTTQLINRLQKFALGEKEYGSDKPIQMSAAQVKAAQALINKTLPDLSSSEITNYQENTLTKEEMYENLVKVVGREMAQKLAPGFKPAIEVSPEKTTEDPSHEVEQ